MHSIAKLVGSQNWVRIGPRDRFIRLCCNPDKVAPTEFETDFFGFRYKGNLNSYIDWSVFFFGAYEIENLQVLKKILSERKSPVFIDIGANVGVHSLYLSKFSHQIHSFEPNILVRSKLEEKIEINNIKNVSIHGVGVSHANEILPFFAPKGNNKGTGSFVAGYSDNNEEFGTPLKLVHGDEYLESLKLNKVDLFKIDVEGFEKNVLLGIKKSLSKFRPIVFMEYSESTKNSFASLVEFMSFFPEDYRVYRPTFKYPLFGVFGNPIVKLIDFDFNIAGGDLIIAPSSWNALSIK